MKRRLDIQTEGLTDVRNPLLRPRMRLALAAGGVAGVLLLAGLFGFQGHLASPRLDVKIRTNTSSAQPIRVAYYKNSYDSYQTIAWQAAVYYGIDPQLFLNQIQQESGFNVGAVSPAGAVGIAQFMPATAANMGVNPWEPAQALYGAARLMSELKAQFSGNYAMALAGYNAGPGAVQNAISYGGNNWYSYLPAETQNYIAVIMHW